MQSADCLSAQNGQCDIQVIEFNEFGTDSNIKTADDIIRIMRRGAPGMFRFDEKSISINDARKIAEYILQTFG